MTDPFETVTPVPRDRWMRPLIVPVGGGKPVPFTRVTTFIGCLDDRRALEKWLCRQVALGLSVRPDLALAVVAHKDDKRQLDMVCEQASEAAKSSAGATVGTALHALTEQDDAGTLDLATVPEAYRADIEAYRAAVSFAGIKVLGSEQFGVHDDLRCAGTWDRVVEFGGHRYIADVKTSNADLSYTFPKAAMQMAIYSRCVLYDPATHVRTTQDVDQDRALVIHLPSGKGECTLHWVDIAVGWEAVALAGRVRAWRARKNLATDFAAAADPVDLAEAIATAGTEYELRTLWANNIPAWTRAHTKAATARKAWLSENTISGQEKLG